MRTSKKNKIVYSRMGELFPKKTTKSHKKRNALILGGAIAVILAGASAKSQDQQ